MTPAVPIPRGLDHSTDLPCEAGLRARRMRGDDLPRVMEIERTAFRTPWSAELLQRELTNDLATILVATETQGDRLAEVILGFIICWLVHDELHILNLAVAQESRRRGVARFLLQQAEAQAREAGAVLATLEVRRSNAAALGLYRSRGYRQIGVRTKYYTAEGEDAIVMLLDL
jgi:ribosomal-protein-alanine N-acetyltransferase